MNILVYDVAAENGGAVSILKQYYERHQKDKDNQYYYLLSVIHLNDTDNITVINRPNVKKGWLHRLFFDLFEAPAIIKANQIDEVVSLQNTIIPAFKGNQTVYMHNILPFADYRFSLSEDWKLWAYQNVIGRIIKWSLKRANRVVVQADWIKARVEKALPQCAGRVEVEFPQVHIPIGYRFHATKCRRFFYPASSERFKNHRLIVEALRLLKTQMTDMSGLEVVFTLTGDETPDIISLKAVCEKDALPVTWRGYLNRESLFEEYARSILIYPSYIETIGLPLYESALVGAPILSADCEYARFVLRGYSTVIYFDPHSSTDLADALIGMMEQLE